MHAKPLMMAALTGLLLGSAASVSAGEPATDAPALFDAAGYRIARYRAPIAADPAPALRISLTQALAFEPGRDALFIDVMPAEGGVRDARSGAWRLGQPHRTIPGAEWHPEAGRMPGDAELWLALERAAREIAPSKPVILFCRVDCWMSWNAARRLALSGLGNVWWLAEGTDGWHEAGRELVKAQPIKVPAPPERHKEN